MMNEHSGVPEVSIVVPAGGAGTDLPPLLESLFGMDFPLDKVEIIIVDNGLSAQALSTLAQWPVTIVEERSAKSPGAARNAGVRAARARVIAFVDSDCIVDAGWLREGIASMDRQNADMLAGRIVFRFSSKRSSAEIFDSLVHMQNEALVKGRKGAVTANLFVRRDVFERIGSFPSYVGEDTDWTRAAVEKGIRLFYEPDAVVTHPTRTLGPLLVKARRVAPVLVREMREGRISAGRVRRLVFWSFVPSPGHIVRARRLIRERGQPDMSRKTLGVAAVSYLYGVWWAAAVLRNAARS